MNDLENKVQYIKTFYRTLCYHIFDKEEKELFEWDETVQKMIDWIEAHLTENPSLLEMSN